MYLFIFSFFSYVIFILAFRLFIYNIFISFFLYMCSTHTVTLTLKKSSVQMLQTNLIEIWLVQLIYIMQNFPA